MYACFRYERERMIQPRTNLRETKEFDELDGTLVERYGSEPYGLIL